MGAPHRRRFLQYAGMVGTTTLSGCTQRWVGGDGPGSSADGTGGGDGGGLDGGSQPIEVAISVDDGIDTRILTVGVRVEAGAGIDRTAVAVDGRRDVVDGHGETERSFEVEVPVDGGRTYEVEVELVDTDGKSETRTVVTDHVPIHVDVLDADRLVGAHYYPWFGELAPASSAHREGWSDESTLTPVLGEYDSHDLAVIDQHLKWCLEHGIGWLSISWWGPGDHGDEIIREHMPATDVFEEIRYSILYETTGRLGKGGIDMDRPSNRRRLRQDLEYLSTEHFGADNYLHIDGRPVLFFYVSQSFRGDVEAAFESVTSEVGVEPYILADLPAEGVPDFPISTVADAVTTYNAYDSREDIESVFHDRYERELASMNLGARAMDADFVPVTIPGFDDTEVTHVTRDNPPLSPSPERFERCCEQLAPHLRDAEAVLVTSFNEWYESTAIEPTEEFGDEYLGLTARHLATGDSEGYEPDGALVTLDWGTTVIPAEERPEHGDDRALAFMCRRLDLLDEGGDLLTTYDVGSDDEPIFVAGTYGQESNGDETWRWFGRPSARTTILTDLEAEEIGGIELRGTPATGMELEVRVDGRASSVELREGDNRYRGTF